MSAYIIAGKADDPSFARAEYAAKQVEAACPNVFFHYEMKHPDAWRDFIHAVFRRYDFHGFPEDFPGPLVWTLEGDLVGGSADFVQEVCVEKFGIKELPSVTDLIFRQIATDNLRQVKLQQSREVNGPPFSERCEAVRASAQAADLLCMPTFAARQRIVTGGAALEVWTRSGDAERLAQLRRAYGNGEAAQVAPGLRVGAVGQEQSHVALLHPEPLSKRHMIIVPRRHVREVTRAEVAAAEAAGQAAAKAAEANGAPLTAEPVPAEEEEALGTEGAASDLQAASEHHVPENDGSLSEALASEVVRLEIPPHAFRTKMEEDLSLQDVTAAVELLQNLGGVGGVATWSCIRGASEYRHPLDTHLQVLPFPLHSAGETSPLRYPLELHLERALREGASTLPAFPFTHTLLGVATPSATEGLERYAGARGSVLDYSKAVLSAYEAARAGTSKGASCSIAFTTSWLLMVPLAPPDVDSASHEAWLALPPPLPCALCGVVICPSLEPDFPETILKGAGLSGAAGKGRLVSNRAVEEGIPEGTPEYEAASREVRISTTILDRPAEIIGVWALPSNHQ